MGVLVALLILGMSVMALTVSARSLTSGAVSELDGQRAFYACEAGMNMALREIYNGSDEDGDGTIGSISNDGNANNDPSIGGARVTVSRTDGTVTTLQANGRSGTAVKRMEATLE